MMRPIHYLFIALLAVPPVVFLSDGRDGAPMPPAYQPDNVINFPHAATWDNAEKPFAPPGFKVTRFTSYLDHPLWLYTLPNGDVLVAEARGGPGVISADRITLLRDEDKDGVAELKTTFLKGLKKPFGMALIGNSLYVANSDSLWRFPYKQGETKITDDGEKVIGLPSGGPAWTRTLLASPDGSKLYVGIGNGSHITESHSIIADNHGSIVEINPDGTGEKTYTTNLTHPVGMDWNPYTNQLWAMVNQYGSASQYQSVTGMPSEPDYVINVKIGSIYGVLPSEDNAAIVDNKSPRPLDAAAAPDDSEKTYPLSGYVGGLGLTFYRGIAFPEEYRRGIFVSEHGAWDAKGLNGYKVSFMPFKNGRPIGTTQPFLTGFIKEKSASSIYGRPAGLAVEDGRLLVADDRGNVVWCVTYVGEEAAAPDDGIAAPVK